MKKLAFVAAALVLAACSGDDKKADAPAAAAPAPAAAAPAADTGMKMTDSMTKKTTTTTTTTKVDSSMKAPAKKP
jgi:hypothetical protein